MSKFKVGDLVTPINMDRYSDLMKQLMGKALVVNSINTDKCGCEVVCARVPGEEGWFLYSDDLRLVSAARPEQPKPKPRKPLKRGDLVTRYGGSICVVVDVSAGGSCWVHPIAGEGSQDYFHFEELTKVGSIRKKAKRLLKQMGGMKNEQP